MSIYIDLANASEYAKAARCYLERSYALAETEHGMKQMSGALTGAIFRLNEAIARIDEVLNESRRLETIWGEK